MNDELERIWKGAVVVYPGIFLEGLRETMQILSQGMSSPNRDLNWACPKYGGDPASVVQNLEK
jgi:hypothetical protein